MFLYLIFFHDIITCFFGCFHHPPFQVPIIHGASNQSSSWPPSLLASRPLNVEHPPPNQNPPGGLSKLGGFQIFKRFINDGLIWCSSQIRVSFMGRYTMHMLIKLAQSTPGTFSLPGPLLIVLCRARLARLLASKRKRMQVCITRVGGMRAKNHWFTRR